MARLLRTFRSRARGLTGDESGSHLLEIAVAMGVLSVAVIGVAGTMNFGMVAAGQARQKSVAAALAAERVERVRNMPYDQVALDVQPSHNADPDHPDHHVTTASPPTYDVRHDGTLYEPLIVGGNVLHAEDPVQRGTTTLYAYQYVTWVDDAAISGSQDYKRITVVVNWTNPMHGGTSNRVVVSSFVGTGDVTIPQATPSPSTPAPASTPTPSPTPAPSCAGDATPPTGSLEILSGAGAVTGYTNSTTVQVRLQASDDCPDLDGELSNDGTSFTDVADLTPDVPLSVAWSVPAGDGSKTVYGRYVDGAANVSATYSATIVLDQTPPAVPGSFRTVSCSMSGTERTVVVAWNASTDANLSGYRLYRSIDSGDWEVVETTASLQGDDTAKKNFDTVRYKVRSYDRAGNESGDSNVLTFSKNSC